jgi:protein-disulfide isomerase/uncharacterized membrane protein
LGTPAFIIYAILSALGVYVSDLLVDIHVQTIYLGSGDSGICASGAAFSCADAANSWLASIAGLPIAALGEAFYAAAIVAVLIARAKPAMSRDLADVFVLGGLAATVYSVFLGVMSAVELGKLCPLCVGLYAINVGLFAVALFTHPAGPKAGFRTSLGAPKTGAFWLTIGLVGAAAIGTQAVYSSRANDALALAKQKKKTKRPPVKVDIELGESPGRGPANAPVVLVEFSDFECPHCKRLSQALKDAAAREPELFRYHFKHYPMDASCNDGLDGVMHKRACAAAVAMVCAQRQGRAWQMHDRLFLNQRALGPAQIETYALSIGIDIEGFRACQKDKSALEAVRRDIAQGDRLGVQGTPTWFANGMREMGARDPDDLLGILRHTKRVAEKENAKENENENEKENANAKPATDGTAPGPEKTGP